MGCEGSATADAIQNDVLTDKGPLASPDLQAFLQRASFDSLDVCQRASSPQPLFSPNGSGFELDDGENYLFSELFPGSLLFPSPTSTASPVSAGTEAIPVSAARLPGKILDICPMPNSSGVLATEPSIPTISISTLNVPVPVKNIPASASEHVTAALEPQPKRRRTTALQDPIENHAFEDADYGSDMSLSYDHSSMENTDFDSRLETKRARNRDAARRMRQRQRQTITKLEVDMGNQYNTINGLLAKLGNLADEIKCTTQENDLLRQLLSSTQCPDIPIGLCNLQCLDEVKGTEDDICSPSLIQSVSLARNLPQEEYTLLEKGACHASCTPLSLRPKAPASPALVAAPAPSPVARPPRAPSASLPPSPFESPKKAARSPSKPHTPQRPALRSPFAIAHHRPSRFCSAAGGAKVPDGMVQPKSPGSKAALLENLSNGGASLQQEVLLALLRKLQLEQEIQLGGAPEDGITEEEAVQIAAMALLESQGNISGAVSQMLAWGGLLQDS